MRVMKDSGVPYIGMIPEDWYIMPLKANYRFHTGFTPPSGQDDLYDPNGETWITIADMKKDITTESEKHITKNYALLKGEKMPAGSLMYSFKLSVGKTSILGCDAYTNEAIATFKEEENPFLPFLKYSSCFILGNANENIYGASILNQKSINNAPLPIPPLSEQRDIVFFLNSKCAAIDEAIERHQRTIEKLNEYKRSVIVRTVFNGLNGEAKRKGEEWFGELPSSWSYVRIKYLLSERNERSEDGKEEPLTMSQKVGIVPTKDFGETPHGAVSFVGAKKVYIGDLVFNKLKAHLGVFSVSKYDGLVSPDYAVYYANKKANPKYLEYIFKTPQCIAEFVKRITGVGQGLMRLYTDELFDITCPCPSIVEQNEIALFLDDLCKKIAEAQQKQYGIISKLEEYRKSLIYHAVTGKIDCREAV